MDYHVSESEVIEKTIFRIKRKFQEGIRCDKKIKYLQQLTQLPITLTILKSTGIGKLVNKLRQEESPICDCAEQLVSKWKNIASVEKSKSPGKLPIESKSQSASASSSKNEFHQTSSSKDRTNEDQSFSSNNGKVSFGDLMMMQVPDANKKKKKKKKELDLLKVPLPTSIDLDAPSFKPSPVYKPSRIIPDVPKIEKQPRENSVGLTEITSKKTRSHMYTGKKASFNGVVPTLYQSCMRILMENIDCLYETGGVPFVLLEPLLSKCTPAQLQRLEYYNDYILDDSDILWKGHCHNEFKGSRIKKDDMESWRETFTRLSEEREERLRRLSTKITASQAAKVPERSVKLAYIAGAPKGSVQTMKKQKRYGTGPDIIGEKRKELKDRIDKQQRSTAEVAIPFANIPKRERCSMRPPSSLSATSRHSIAPAPKRSKDDLGTQGPSRLMPNPVKKPGKKPMMAAALKLMHKQKGRHTSQIIRR